MTRDISAYLLMQIWNSVFFSSLFVTAVWMSCKCSHVMFVLLFIGWLFFVKSLQGWDKDKFSGLNSGDERHLRLLSDAVLEQRFLLQHAICTSDCRLCISGYRVPVLFVVFPIMLMSLSFIGHCCLCNEITTVQQWSFNEHTPYHLQYMIYTSTFTSYICYAYIIISIDYL